jgi:hypothetical protein
MLWRGNRHLLMFFLYLSMLWFANSTLADPICHWDFYGGLRENWSGASKNHVGNSKWFYQSDLQGILKILPYFLFCYLFWRKVGESYLQ